jgi:ABC-type Na+ transport system ATPase subunit NatA
LVERIRGKTKGNQNIINLTVIAGIILGPALGFISVFIVDLIPAMFGRGKSTLLFHLLGLFKASQGMIRVFGFDPSKDYVKIRERIGALLQNVEEQIIAPTV